MRGSLTPTQQLGIQFGTTSTLSRTCTIFSRAISFWPRSPKQTENDSKNREKKNKRNSAVVRGVIPLHAWSEWIETIHWHEQEMESTWYAMIACPLFRLHIFWIQPKCNRIAMVLFDFPIFFPRFARFSAKRKFVWIVWTLKWTELMHNNVCMRVRAVCFWASRRWLSFRVHNVRELVWVWWTEND